MKSMTKLGLAMLVAGLVCLGIPKANAEEFDGIAVTVTLTQLISVDVTPADWTLVIALNSTNAVSCVASNNGNGMEKFTIMSTEGTGGWANTGTVGTDSYKLAAATNVELNVYDIPVVNGGTAPLAGKVPQAGVQAFGLQYSAPTGDTVGAGLPHTFNVTVTAAADLF